MHSQITEKTGPEEKQKLPVSSNRCDPFFLSKRILVIFGKVMKPAEHPIFWLSKQLGMAMRPNSVHGMGEAMFSGTSGLVAQTKLAQPGGHASLCCCHILSLSPACKVMARAPAAMLGQVGDRTWSLCSRLAESRKTDGF